LVVLATAVALTVALAPSATSAVQPPTVSEAVDIALNHVRTNAESLGLTPGDVDELLVTDANQDAHNGVTHVYCDRR
jgi:hypothetical protein